MVRANPFAVSTARGVAVLRALDMQRPEQRRLAADPYAPYFVNPLTVLATRAALRLGMLRLVGFEPMINFALARERLIGELMDKEATGGVGQIVILGAGFDTRAYRLADGGSVPIFEVDHPVTQRAKRRAIAGVVEPLPVNVRFVAVDFDRDDLGARLRDAGYRDDRRTLFVWQGVIMYLTEDGIDATLGVIANHSASGSLVVFDYMYARLLRRMDGPSPLGLFTHAVGERMSFAIDPDQLGPFLSSRGLELVETFDGAALERRYAGRLQGRGLERHAAIAVARVTG